MSTENQTRYIVKPHSDGFRVVDTVDRRIIDTAGTSEEAEEALQNWLDEEVCSSSDCDEPLDDGEGYDGYCGNCADVLESEGYWS